MTRRPARPAPPASRRRGRSARTTASRSTRSARPRSAPRGWWHLPRPPPPAWGRTSRRSRDGNWTARPCPSPPPGFPSSRYARCGLALRFSPLAGMFAGIRYVLWTLLPRPAPGAGHPGGVRPRSGCRSSARRGPPGPGTTGAAAGPSCNRPARSSKTSGFQSWSSMMQSMSE